MALAGLLPAGEPRLAPLTGAPRGGGHTPMGAGPDGHTHRAHGKQADTLQGVSDWIDVPAGPFEMGAGPTGSPTTTSVRATPSSCPPFKSPAYR